jgi:hypothetical protein
VPILVVLSLAGAMHPWSRAWGAAAAGADPARTQPAYDSDRRLLLPEGYQRWIFVGSSLGLSYTEGMDGHEMFHHTLMEPTAHAHFLRTGEFREGTMLVLLLHGASDAVLPGRRGRFAGEIHGVEMAVKDSSRVPEGWAYYNFGGMGAVSQAAAPFPRGSCYSCHERHAAHDKVFVQFYPLLTESAPAGWAPSNPQVAADAPAGSDDTGAPPAPAAAEPVAAQQNRAAASEERARPAAPLALRGLDPVFLAEGREESGKPEIVAEHEGYRYRFLTEPSRARFARYPDRYAIQNETCPVMPGAAIDPGLFSVHEGMIYAFGSESCLQAFRRDPASFLGGPEAEPGGFRAAASLPH